MNNIGIFKIEYTKENKKTKKNFLYLDNFTYSTCLDLYQKSKTLLKRYANMNNIIMLEYDPKEKAYITYNSSKKRILLYPIKNKIQ